LLVHVALAEAEVGLAFDMLLHPAARRTFDDSCATLSPSGNIDPHVGSRAGPAALDRRPIAYHFVLKIGKSILSEVGERLS
jgi:hypothetical protein